VSRVFARGTRSRGICDRCGWEYAYLELKAEPGTLQRVCRECNDGMWNRVDHPQNHPPHDLSDAQGLEFPRPDRVETSSQNIGPIQAEDDTPIFAENNEELWINEDALED
jgi:hypothetical protein